MKNLFWLLFLSANIVFAQESQLCSKSQITLPQEVSIKVDVSQKIGPLHHFWRSTGFSPANLLLNADMQQALTYVGSIPHQGMTHVRIHYLLELVKITNFLKPNVEYDWSVLDERMDVLVKSGLKPFFELMGYPAGMFVDFENDKHLHGWKDFISATIKHYIDRYGIKEVRSWYFETWNEPDISFWKQSDEAFMNYYDACSEGLKAVDQKLIFGGPGTARTMSDRFKNLLAHCDNGTNYFTKEKGVRLDFISVHEKGVRSHNEDLKPNTKSIIERESRAIDYIQTNHPEFKKLPFINNECDPQVGWSRFHTWRALPYYPAIAAKIINQHIIALGDEKGVNYELLSNDNGFLGPWGNRSLLARFGELKNVDIGQSAERKDLLRFEEDMARRKFEQIKKPIYNLMVMLSLLGDNRVAISGPESWTDETGVIASERNEEQVAVLVYNSRDNMYSSGSNHIQLQFENIPFKNAMVVHYRIDEKFTNPFPLWENMGAPNILVDTNLQALQDRMELEMLYPPEKTPLPDGTLETCFDLPLHGVSLILVSKKPATGPPQVKNLRHKAYDGLGEIPRNMIIWDSLDSRFIKTFKVLFSNSENGPFERLNSADLLCSAFQHNIPRKGGFYKVQAVDFWGRTGKESDVLQVD